MKAWLANMLWDALAILLCRVHDWVFDPERAARLRFENRKRWWAYKERADTTFSKRDDKRAEWYRIVFGFETPPEQAIRRGDLDSFRGV